MEHMENTGLPLEYQRDYGTARRNLNLADLMDDTGGEGKARIFGLRFQEQTSNSRFVEACTFFDNGANALLVGLDTTQSFE